MQTAPFDSILCGVNGSRASLEAARQAIILAEPNARLQFVAVADVRGTGLVAVANLSRTRAKEVLGDALRLAEQAGIAATADLRTGSPTSDLLLDAAEDHDLLVVGSHGRSRREGIMIGSTASQLAHRTAKPLLIARGSLDGAEFPGAVLIASDGSEGSWAATRLAAAIARGHSADVGLVSVGAAEQPELRGVVAEQVVAIREMTGLEPVVTLPSGRTVDGIVEAAREHGASLLAIGHRGVHGARALGSVSERVAHQSPCSVLVVPPGEQPGSGRMREVEIEAGRARLEGELFVPDRPAGLVIFAHGSGSSRFSARNRKVAAALNRRRLATLLFDLLTSEEENDRSNVFDISLLAERLLAATRWARHQDQLRDLPIGYFGASTGAAAALCAAADLGDGISAVVSRGGRPDLAEERLDEVTAPTLLIVGGNDWNVIPLNDAAASLLGCPHQTEIVRGATHLFEEPGALDQVAKLAGEWFSRHMLPIDPHLATGPQRSRANAPRAPASP